ncbi:MAG TPA: RNA methyltransferase [Acidimicrobiia bacterium]|nr:RNA methyltransferase [Acidimicrobiia bacterium]
MAEASRLHRSAERAATGLTLIEGPHLLEEAASAGAQIHTVFSTDPETIVPQGAELVAVADAALDRLSGTKSPRGPVAVIGIPPSVAVTTDQTLVLYGLADPGNVGSLIRSAAAFGAGVIVGPGTADPWSPKTLRAAAGGHFRTMIEMAPHLDPAALTARGWEVVSTVVTGGVHPDELRAGRHALMIGDEARGLPPEVAAYGRAVTISMPGGTESLNAAAAGAVLLFALTKTAKGAGGTHG